MSNYTGYFVGLDIAHALLQRGEGARGSSAAFAVAMPI
jgi:hypothetical protein